MNFSNFPVGKYKFKQHRTSTLKRHSILLKWINHEISRFSMLKSDVVSALKSNVVSTLKSDVDSTLKSDVASTLESEVDSTLKSYVDSTLKFYVDNDNLRPFIISGEKTT